MKRRGVSMHGIRINGKWYYSEALHGRRRDVYSGEPAGDTVEIYDMGGARICTATLLELGV